MREKTPKWVVKRDGRRQKFELRKLEHSLASAFHHAGEKNHFHVSAIAHEVLRKLGSREAVNVRQVRKCVVVVLHAHKLKKAADYYDLAFLHIRKPRVKKVRKRDDTIEAFQPVKVYKSICRAFKWSKEPIGPKCELLTKQAVASLEKRYAGKVVPVEEVRGTVEKVLVKSKLPDIAKGYVKYRYM